MMQKLQKLRWMIIRWLLTSNEKQDLADICPDIWDDYRELITGES
jgi:hypothetical protein